MKSDTIESIEIVTACFVINFMYGGASKLGSLFFVESIIQYDINRKEASFPYVLLYLVRNLCGPFLGYIQQIFGIKSLIIFGNILAIISIAACFFADDIFTVTILWGVIFGCCFALGTQYLPSLLNLHFTEHRNKANGFAYSGLCFGGTLLPPIIDVCIKNYGLNGSFLILAGIMAHLIPFTLLLKSPEQKSNCRILTRKNTDNSHAMKKDDKSILPALNPSQNIRNENSHNNSSNDAETRISTPNEKIYNQTPLPTEANNHKSPKIVRTDSPSIFSLENFKIFIDPPFIVMLFVVSGITVVFTTMGTIILDFVRDKGVGVNLEIYYVMILSLADIFGRMGSGFVIDKNYLPITWITSICCVGTGLSLLGLLFVSNYILLMLVEFLLPLFYGSVFVLHIALVHKFMQPEKRIMAMTSRNVLYAPMSIFISPMIGYFKGENGSYDGVIFILTGISFLCGFITYFIPHLEKRRRTATQNTLA